MRKKSTVIIIFTIFFIFLAGGSYFSNCQNSGKLKNGDKAPELSYNNPEGKPIALSSLKGKIVLIDFWAGWCGPCRRNNPYIVKIYEKYKDAKFDGAKGFTIYSLSLDKSKEVWVNAIKQDNLSWQYHVSDLQFWNSEGAVKYGINSIPATFLIDENGVIIGKNLHHDDIDFILNKRLKK